MKKLMVVSEFLEIGGKEVNATPYQKVVGDIELIGFF